MKSIDENEAFKNKMGPDYDLAIRDLTCACQAAFETIGEYNVFDDTPREIAIAYILETYLGWLLDNADLSDEYDDEVTYDFDKVSECTSKVREIINKGERK